MDTQMILRIVALVLGIIGNVALVIAIIGFIKDLNKLLSNLKSLERRLSRLQIDVNDNLYEIENIKKSMSNNDMEQPSDAGDTDI